MPSLTIVRPLTRFHVARLLKMIFTHMERVLIYQDGDTTISQTQKNRSEQSRGSSESDSAEKTNLPSRLSSPLFAPTNHLRPPPTPPPIRGT